MINSMLTFGVIPFNEKSVMVRHRLLLFIACVAASFIFYAAYSYWHTVYSWTGPSSLRPSGEERNLAEVFFLSFMWFGLYCLVISWIASITLRFFNQQVFKYLSTINADDYLGEIKSEHKRIRHILQEDITNNGEFTAAGYWQSKQAQRDIEKKRIRRESTKLDRALQEAEKKALDDRYPNVFTGEDSLNG